MRPLILLFLSRSAPIIYLDLLQFCLIRLAILCASFRLSALCVFPPDAVGCDLILFDSSLFASYYFVSICVFGVIVEVLVESRTHFVGDLLALELG